MMSASSQMLEQCAARLGKDKILSPESAAKRYGPSTSPLERRFGGAVFPAHTGEVSAVVAIAASLRVPLYPISTGRNWGYGTALPAVDDCVVVDLSSMSSIVEFDHELGIVTLEPGVTQQMLYEYISSRDLPFLVPTTGAGPDCSLVGNALDRGFGVTPTCDHFLAVNSLEAVLADGTVYSSAVQGGGGRFSDPVYKWGVGPYLDGLFSQANFGIVTKMTIALERRRPAQETFFVTFAPGASFETIMLNTRECFRELAPVLVSAMVLNPERVRQTRGPESGPGGWMLVGSLAGRRNIVRAARRTLRRIVSPVAAGFRCSTVSRIDRIYAMANRLPFRFSPSRKAEIYSAREAARLMAGIPSSLGLNVAYSFGRTSSDAKLDPARDGCGLLWYAPLVPFTIEHLNRMKTIIERECNARGFSPSITFNCFNERCIDCTIPIIFDAEDPNAVETAYACHRSLVDSGKAAGYLPYRYGVYGFDQLVDSNVPFWAAAAKLRAALDPHDIISPGRYGLTNRK